MVELLLLFGTICLFFFLPVDFRIYYRKIGAEDTLILDMVFIKGLVRRRKVLSPLGGSDQKSEKTFGRWFFMRKRQIKQKPKPESTPEAEAQPEGDTISSMGKSLEDFQEFLKRYQDFGLGITLLSYFLPAQYHHWLLVTPELERRGYFQKFNWSTQYGTGNPVSTALGYGALWGVKAGIGAYFQGKIKFKNPPRLEVIPDFLAAKWDTIFDCIFRIKLGYIIIAAVLARVRLRMMKGGVEIE